MTPKQQQFVLEYLIEKNATQAAKRAGYKGNQRTIESQGSALLSNREVAEAIRVGLEKQKNHLEAAAKARGVTRDRWLQRLEEIAFSNIGDAFQPDERGKLTMKIEDMKRSGFTALIRKMKVLPGGKLEMDLLPVLPALEQIGKAHGWVREIHQHEGAIDISAKLTAEDLRSIYSSPEAMEAALKLAELTAPPPPRTAKEETNK